MEIFETVTCTREALFEQVWTEPMTKLAKRYGISDVGLAKVCRRYNIPVPERGHWRRVELGQAPRRPPLPALAEDLGEIVFRVRKATLPGQELPEAAQVNAQIEAEADLASRIVVAAELESPHPHIKQAKAALRQARKDERGLLRPSSPCLDIRVSKEAIGRALRIMDAILKGCVARGYGLSLEKTYYDGRKSTDVVTQVVILEQELEISLEEIVEPSEHRLTEAEKKKQGANRWYTPWPRYDFTPTGRLVLKINNIWNSGLRKTWSDGKQQRLDDCLNDFLANLLKAALAKRADKLERERREAEHRAWMAQQAELERQRREEEERFQQLAKEARAWRQSNELRSYIDAVRKVAIERHGEITPGSDIDRWIRWATTRADMLNPLVKEPGEP